MAEVPFRPARQLSEYKGKGASASRECIHVTLPMFRKVYILTFLFPDFLVFEQFVWEDTREIACSRRSDSGARAKNKASERAGKNEGRLGKRTRERL